MNWEALGALAELLAAIAVLPTLVYLALQLRQNTRALQSSTFQDLSATMSLSSEMIASTPEVASLIVRANHGLAELNEEERVRFSFLLMLDFRRLESLYVQNSFGFIDSRIAEGKLTPMHPGFGRRNFG